MEKRFNALITLFIVGIISSFTSCKKKESFVFDDKYTLKKSDHIIFDIDSMTKTEHAINGFSPYYNSLCVYNEINNSIYLFDVETQETKKVIQMDQQGPNGVSKVRMMLVHNPDSIFLFNESTSEVLLINEDAVVKIKYKIFDRDEGDPAIILEPEVYLDQNNLYFLGRTATFTEKSKDKNIVKYSLINGEKSYLMDYPESYLEGKWGGMQLRKYALPISNSDSFVVSHVFDPFVHVFNQKSGGYSKFYAGSDLMHQSNQITKKEKSSVGQYMLGNSWYNRLFYDRYNNVYLRSAFVGYDMNSNDALNQEYRSKNGDDIRYVTIILDENFIKIGEVRGLNFYKSTFSTEDGIYIQDFTIDENNENIMVFSRYELVRK